MNEKKKVEWVNASVTVFYSVIGVLCFFSSVSSWPTATDWGVEQAIGSGTIAEADF